jgi:predicted methyltransferase
MITMMGCPRRHIKTNQHPDTRAKDIKAYIAAELDPARDQWQRPDEVIEALWIKSGETVADIGAGAGYFTLKLAKAVGGEGTVYATETQVDLLTEIIKRSTEGGFPNVKIIEAQPSAPLLPYSSVDLAFVCNNLSRVEYIYSFFDQIRQGLKKGGRLAVIDWQIKSEMGPDPDRRVKPAHVRKMLEGMGFRLIKEYDFLPRQYFMVFSLEERYE